MPCWSRLDLLVAPAPGAGRPEAAFALGVDGRAASENPDRAVVNMLRRRFTTYDEAQSQEAHRLVCGHRGQLPMVGGRV